MSDHSTYDVFLSHNSADKAAVEILARHLQEEAGLNPFLDQWHLVPGEPWQEALEEALDHSATVAVFVGSSGVSPWHNEEMRAALDARTRDKDLRVIPVLLPGAAMPERGSLPRFLSRLTWVDFRHGLDDPEALRRLVSGVRGVAPGPGPDATVAVDDHPPYRGLEKFRPEDAEWFFGRDSETQQLVEKLKTQRFLAVLGPSGSGKSSVVLAGLVPALGRGVPPGGADWPVLIFSPTERPLEELAARLTDLVPKGSVAQLLRDLEADEKTLHLTSRLALLDAPGDRRLMLVVDQFEEAFTLCGDRHDREQFFANLLYAADAEGGRATVVLTMRADFLAKCAEVPPLADRLAAFQFLVTPMVESQLREAVEGPAARAGLELEPGLADMIVSDVVDQPGGLPLLEHALYELWKRRRGRLLTFEAYREIGGVTGALARTADATYEALDERQQNVARRILLDLVQLGEGTEDTRRRAGWSELVTKAEEAETVDLVLQRLADQRLVTTGQERETDEPVVNMAHEALIRGWPRLRKWIDDNRAGLRIHRRLTEAAREWQEKNHDESFLYGGARLTEAEEWAEANAGYLNPLEREFVSSSVSAGKRARMQRIAISAVAMLLVIAALAGFAIFQNQAATRERNLRITAQANADERATAVYDGDVARETAVAGEENARQSQAQAEYQARMALARQLANQAAFYRRSDPQLALLLAMQAVSATYDEDGYTTLEAGTALRGLMSETYKPVLTSGGGHGGSVTWAGFTPDGERVVTASWDGTARVWDVDTGDELAVLEGHTDGILNAGLSPDGERVVSASTDSTARVWDVAIGQELVVLEGHTSWVRWAGFTLDGERVVTASDDNTARVWDATTGEELTLLGGENEGDMFWWGFSPDERRFATTHWRDYTVRIYDVASGEERITLEEHVGPVWWWDHTPRVWDVAAATEVVLLKAHAAVVVEAKFSPDGERVVTASLDGTARLWDAATGQELAALEGHTGPVGWAEFSPDGERVVTASADTTSVVWDAATGRELAVLEGHTDSVLQAKFSPDGERVVTASGDGTARVWDAATGEGLVVLGWGHSGGVRWAGFSPDGQRFVTASEDDTARIWDTATGADLVVLEGHTDDVLQAEFSPDGERVVTTSEDDTARIWDAAAAEEPILLVGHTDAVEWAGFSPDGERVATSSDDGTARVWDVATGEELIVLGRGHGGSVRWAGFSPDGQRFVTASEDDTARIWDTATGAELVVLEGHTDDVLQAEFSPDGERVVTTSEDDTARIWDAATAEEPILLVGHTDDVEWAGFSPDGERVVTTSKDDTARIWDVATGAEVAVLERHTDDVLRAWFSPDGRRVVTASRDNTARVWDADTGEQLAILEEHYAPVWWAGFNPTGEQVLTASQDGTARVWQLSGEPDRLSLVGHQAGVWHTLFDPSGRWIASAGQDGVARIWEAETGQEVAQLAGHGGEATDDGEWCPECIQSVAFSPSGDRALTAGWDGTARIWDTQSGEELETLVGHEGRIIDAVFNPTGTLVATAGEDQTVCLWDAEEGGILFVVETISGTSQINFSPDGSQLVAAGVDGCAWLWDTATGEEWAKLEGEESSLIQAIFSPDGRRIAAANWDGTGFVWDIESGERIATLEGHTGEIWEIVYSPGGDLIGTASEDHTARLWDATSGEELFVLRGHNQPVLGIAFSPTGRQVTTGSADGTVRLWNTHTGDPEALLPDTRAVEVLVNWDVSEARQAGVITSDEPLDIRWVSDVSYGPSGDRVVAASMDGSLEIYVADTRVLLEIAQSQVSRELTCQERVQFLYENLDCPSPDTATPSPTVTGTPAPQ